MKNNLPASIILILFCALTAHVQASVRPFVVCDTLTTVEGKIYLVSNVEIQWQEIHFTSCDDALKVYSIPKNRVASIKKAMMPRV